MKIEFTEEELGALLRLLTEEARANSMIVQAVYVPPAARLRQQADAMEQKEADYPIIAGIVAKLQRSRDEVAH